MFQKWHGQAGNVAEVVLAANRQPEPDVKLRTRLPRLNKLPEPPKGRVDATSDRRQGSLRRRCPCSVVLWYLNGRGVLMDCPLMAKASLNSQRVWHFRAKADKKTCVKLVGLFGFMIMQASVPVSGILLSAIFSCFLFSRKLKGKKANLLRFQ
ncbi:hypothetical protein B0H63DRAFT_284150 [Podospora didyma]|uniref:Uncharacterized protein n=1 Tax=Podospora didyma TaxID=330526 RepID=A0AAE0K9E1_9PEZI|nr:hypothetical protein B0H63DRAFT_284150 [Podospora didyma]